MLDPNTIPRDDSSSEIDCLADPCVNEQISSNDNGSGPDGQDDSSSNEHNDSVHRVPMDIESFDEVFRRQQAELRLYALKIVGSQEIAEDIVNEVFTKTYDLVSEGKEIDRHTIGGWLLRCVRNSSINTVRKRKRRQHVSLDDENGSIVDTQDINEKLHSEDRSMQILDTVSTLPKKQRKAFLLYDIQGLDYKETAAAMGTSANSIRQLLFRARRNIRNDVGPETAGLAAPMLRTDLFSLDEKPSFMDRVAQYVSDMTVRYTSYFNQLGERLASVSTPAIAAILFGAAIIISQSQSEESAIGAVLDPAQIILSIHANPVGSDGLVTDSTPVTNPARDGSASSSPQADASRNDAGSRNSNKAGRSAFSARFNNTRLSNCDPCHGMIIDLLIQAVVAIDVDREEIFDVRHERRKNRRIRRSIRKHRHARRAHRRETRLEWQDNHQTAPSTKPPGQPAGESSGEDSNPGENTGPSQPPGPPSSGGAGQGSGDGNTSPQPPPPSSDTPPPPPIKPPQHPGPRPNRPPPPKSTPRPTT